MMKFLGHYDTIEAARHVTDAGRRMPASQMKRASTSTTCQSAAILLDWRCMAASEQRSAVRRCRLI